MILILRQRQKTVLNTFKKKIRIYLVGFFKMFFNKLNIWFFCSLIISLFVIIPILTVSVSFFEDTSRYFDILKQTFLFEYILNSLSLLIGVLILTFFLGVGSAYVSRSLHTCSSVINYFTVHYLPVVQANLISGAGFM